MSNEKCLACRLYCNLSTLLDPVKGNHNTTTYKVILHNHVPSSLWLKCRESPCMSGMDRKKGRKTETWFSL